MSGITFGSVGDVIAVGQIAWALAQALTDSRGSAKVYQGLVKELKTFDQALLQVVALWQNYQESPELKELGEVTRNAVREWKEILLEFRLKVDKKYGTNLALGGSGNWVKDASKKFLWLKEKEDIMELRRKLQTGSDAITMLCLAAMGKSNKLDHKAQAVRVELVHGLLQESIKRAEEQMNMLKSMDEKLDRQAQKSDMILTTVKSNFAYLTQIPSIAINMRSLLSLLQSHLISQQATPRGLGTTWQQAPVTLEDALGFMIPIPLELVNSWDMFDMIIAKRFEKHKSHSKILRGEYAIEEDTTGREVNRASEWSMCLRPGQKIDMSMVFSELDVNSNHCPRCRTASPASLDERTQCVNPSCKMWFTRIVEAEEEPDEDFEHIKTPSTNEPGEKIPKRAGPILSPGDFQRVRLLRKLVTIEKEAASSSAGVYISENPNENLEAEFQERFIADLKLSGMDDAQIALVLQKKTVEDSARPTYTRMARRHLSLETLNTYRVDYDIDQDPGYVLIKRWVPEYEQDFFWAHTKEIREKRTQPRRDTPNAKEAAEQRRRRLGSDRDNLEQNFRNMGSRSDGINNTETYNLPREDTYWSAPRYDNNPELTPPLVFRDPVSGRRRIITESDEDHHEPEPNPHLLRIRTGFQDVEMVVHKHIDYDDEVNVKR